jgi:MFS family permease
MSQVAASTVAPTDSSLPARLPFYYGWIILAVASLAMTATLPGRTHGLGLITEPLLEDLSISDVSYGALNFWSIVLAAFFCFPVGRAVDRIGTRGVLTLVTAGLGMTVVIMRFVDGWWSLFVALIFTRGLGQGALSVLSTTLVGKWFTRRLGWAMGVFALLLAIGFIGSILSMEAAIRQFGWRAAWEGMGWVLLVGLSPVCWVLVRSTPEECGLSDNSAGGGRTEVEVRGDLPLRAALASPAFWVFTAASCLFGMAWSAITLYNESVLASRGFGRDSMVLVMSILVGVGLIANLIGGGLAARWPLGRVLAIGMALFAMSLLAFPFVRNTLELILYASALGVASGLITVVHFAFHPKAFGRAHLGQIQGFFQVLSVFTSALGPLILALCNRWTGSYTAMFLAAVPISLVLAVAAIYVPMPHRPPIAAVNLSEEPIA